jgi:hypothetical protein
VVVRFLFARRVSFLVHKSYSTEHVSLQD